MKQWSPLYVFLYSYEYDTEEFQMEIIMNVYSISYNVVNTLA